MAMALLQYDATVPEHLLCPVCYEVPPGRIAQCHAGHLICAHTDPAQSGGELCCLAKLHARAAVIGVAAICPVCRVPLPGDNRCIAAERSIALLPTACRHCAADTTRGNLAAHEAICPTAPTVGSVIVTHEERAEHEALCALRALGELNRVRPSDGATQLWVAAFRGDADVVSRLIAAGADVEAACTIDDTTPLYIAAAEGHADVVELLIAAGADFGSNSDGVSPLLRAAAHGHVDVVAR